MPDVDQKFSMRFLSEHPLVTSLIGAIIGAVLTYVFTNLSNGSIQKKTRDTEYVTQFESSGSKMDVELGSLADAIASGKSTDEIKSEVRTAVAEHAAAAHNLHIVSGEQPVKDYLKSLSDLRINVDTEKDAIEAMQTARIHAHLVEQRNTISENAKKWIDSE